MRARPAPLLILAAAAGLVLLAAPSAFAQLALTTAGANAGFQLTTFATGFPNIDTYGPLGMAFSGTGVLVSGHLGNVRQFPTTADGQNAGSVNPAANFGAANAEEIVSANGNYYMARRAQGDLVQLNANGTLNQVIVTGLHGAPSLYVCPNPANGHLFVAGGTCHTIWDVDPVAKTATVWLNTLPDPQQMTFSEDGQMLFVTQATNPGDVLGIDAMTKATIFDYAALNPTNPLNKPAGVAIGSGSLERDLFVTCGDGTVWQIDRGDATATEIASGGTRGQAVRCSINNSLLVAQTDRIMRLTAPAGGASGFGYNSPYNFTAVAVSDTQIALYWDGVPGAIGYNIYRSYSAGGEDYNALPQNGATPWTQHSYAGGNNYLFVDSGLHDAFYCFYTVKAVFPEGSSVPSYEDSDAPDPNAIPYNSSSPGDVLAALRNRYNDGQIPLADDLQSAMPDGRVYAETVAGGATSILPAAGICLRYTDQFRYADGTYTTIPEDPVPYHVQGIRDPNGPVSVSTTSSLAPSDGPYRRVTIDPSGTQYAGVKGTFFVPDANHAYLNGAYPKDGLFLYFGSSGQGLDVDAGLEHQPWSFAHPHTNGWTLFISMKGGPEDHVDSRFFPNADFDFAGGQTISMVYLARPSVQYPQWSKLGAVISATDSSGKTMTRYSKPAYQAGRLSLRRVYSIAQGMPPVNYRRTNSFMVGATFSGGTAIQYGERNDMWDFGMTLDSQTGSYPAQGSIINWVETYQYFEDDYININLQ